MKESQKNNQGTEQATITKRADDYSQWYTDVIEAAQLAEHAPVRGCMVIKPYGYALWENMRKVLDEMFKEQGVQNAYFPLLIPEEFFQREAAHIEGFSPELAVVTHAGGKKLDEPLVIRPTSETIIYDSFSRWIKSYRDLPLLINQWANVVRWELRPRLFLRTTEFLWQEGHTAHETGKEAQAYARTILENVYKRFGEEYLAMPLYTGQKSEKEKFAGAKETYCIEALMQDGKSLQAGTSHYLADHFAKVFNVSFQDKEGKVQFAEQTSWGVSTRLIGGLIMLHGDDKGIIMPPKIAPIQIVVVPIGKDSSEESFSEAAKIVKKLAAKYAVKLDERIYLTTGEKYYEWEKKGVPLRLEIGPKDLAKKQCVLARRDTGEKIFVPLAELSEKVAELLDAIQADLFAKALKQRDETNQIVDTWDDFVKAVETGGYIFAHWCEETACELQIKEKTKATTRCQPFNSEVAKGEQQCILCGKKSPSNKRWIFCKAY